MADPFDALPFPCRRVPEDDGTARLLGLYPERQEGLWMQRTKILGGGLTGPQWRALADAARRFTPDTPLHLTTRQDIEIHDVTTGRVPEVQAALADAGVTVRGACGDTPRNVIVCPGSGLRRGRPDLVPIAWDVRRHLEATDGITDLPRKFKISFSACPDACGGPWIHDLGFLAEQRDGRWGFRVVGAGSLGARPNTGIALYDWIEPDDVLPLVAAAIAFFAEHGDRENRRRARLRHVRERMGDEAFREALDRTFAAHREAFPRREAVGLKVPDAPLDARWVLTFVNGNVSPEAAEALANLADGTDTAVRIGCHHRVHVFGRDEAAVRSAVEGQGALAGAARPQPSVVACSGARWCRRGLARTDRLADRIRERFAGRLDPAMTVCVSGCPNGCAHTRVADIGLTGGQVRTDGGREEAWTLYTGGGMGRTPALAEQVAARLSADEVLAEIGRLTGGA
jgi:sulfite reductase beta subunit-like hemoprotein